MDLLYASEFVLCRKSSNVELGGPSLKSVTNGSSHSVQDVALVPTSPPLEEHPAPMSNLGAISLVAALMQDAISSLTDAVVLAREQPVPEAAVATTSSTVATLVALKPEVETKAAEVLEVMAAIPSSKPDLLTSRAMVPLGAANAEAHGEPLVAREINLDDIQLIDDPLLDMEMVARMMEMYRHVGVYAEIISILLLP